ncbi:eukaryotic translation initiation factor 4gamma [Lichtheimia corymbifera JMRC:FSU:9682]|uniref:Eukaryotic translation initiation factor 4gamma n=1 Tax=Lichtheimia corymbifera JMRC:FSU:9682 TaxID=1263082 RepID=A0A068RQ49_9FUNG|nr:eukaryotic translation initiation factor 4gamma [Lichtheimia corymbifera JMRC:FSU:9682]
MNRTPNTNETNNGKSTTRAVFNYAAAAKRSSQIQDRPPSQTQQQQPNTNQSPANSRSTSQNERQQNTRTTSNGSASINGTATDSAESSTQQSSFASAVAKETPSKNGSAQSSPASKGARSASVQLPQAPPADSAPIQFGSINQDDSPNVITESWKTEEGPNVNLTIKFGSLPATDTDASSASPQQPPQQPPQQRRDSTQSNHSASDSQQQQQQQPPQHYGGNRHYSGQRYNQNKNISHSPNMQNAQAGYVPHHQKQSISPLMGQAPSPSMPGQNIPMPNSWASPAPVHGHIPQYFVPPQNFDGQRSFYPPTYDPMAMNGMSGQTQHYVPPPRSKNRIRIVDPNTGKDVNMDNVNSTSSSASSTSTKETPVKSEKKVTSLPPSTSKAIPIVDPAITNREKRDREEAAQRAKEEAERKEREEKEREEAERKAKEEAERKEREEKEREEAERKAKEEAERKEREEKEREEAERKAKEEAEQKEREQKEREEAERKAKEEEAERKAKEEADKKAKEAEEQQAKPAETGEEKATKTPARLDMAAVSSSSNAATAPATPATPATARKTPTTPMRTIEDFSAISYPEDVKPSGGTRDTQSGKLQYDPKFLLQFQPLCRETSEDLSVFKEMMSEESNERGSRQSSRRQGSERGRGPRTPGSPMDMGMFRHGSKDGRMEMGKFAGGRPLSHRAGSGSHGLPPPGSPGGMQREGSHGGRSRSGRGGKRHGGKEKKDEEKEQKGGPTIPPEQVVPLEKSQNRWVPLAMRKKMEAAAAAAAGENAEEEMPDELIIRKVKSLLNKLTFEKFDSISSQIWEYASYSKKEDNGRALRLVIQLTFDKACDEPAFAPMWAQLCERLYQSMTDDIKDVNVFDKEGKIVHGAHLFRKYLLNRCQSDFERGWKMQIPKMDENNADMLTDEYYAAVKAKRQGLGLVQLIGELFKRRMLTERIMIQCFGRLCADPKTVGDEETETMCKLMTTVGKNLDVKGTRDYLDAFFERMNEMTESPNLSSRVKFMIMDVFDLRKNKWVSRRGNQPAPTTIAEVHEQAAKAKSEEKEAMKRTTSSRGNLPHPMSRGGSHRGAGAKDLKRENSQSGNASTSVDGWNTVGPGSPGGTTKGSRVNELANFGKTDRSKTRSSVLGPSSNSPFASLNRAGSKSGEQKNASNDSRSSPSSMGNMFSALGGEEGDHDHNEGAEDNEESTERQENEAENEADDAQQN